MKVPDGYTTLDHGHTGRRPSRWMAGLTVLVLAALGAACSGGSDGTTEPGKSAASDSISAAAASSSAPAPETGSGSGDDGFDVAAPVISPQAIGLYGAGLATAATQAAVEFSERAFYDGSCMTVRAGVDRDRCAVSLGDAMTDKTRSGWVADTKTFIADARAGEFGSRPGSRDVLSLTFYAAFPPGKLHDGHGNTSTVTTSEPFVTDQRITKVSTSVDTDGERLVVLVTATADIHLVTNGRPDRVRLPRTCTYFMREVDGVWEIDGWRGNYDRVGLNDGS